MVNKKQIVHKLHVQQSGSITCQVASLPLKDHLGSLGDSTGEGSAPATQVRL